MAERGLDSVSLVDISRAAGQKNRGALQYHFGDKEGLINAVLDKHSEGIARARALVLDQLQSAPDYSLQDAVEALVLPVAAKLSDEDGGAAFLNINSQLMSSASYALLRRARVKNNPEARRLETLMAAKLPVVNSKITSARLIIADGMLFHGLATYLSRPAGIAQKVFVKTLVVSIAAVLAVP